MTNFCDEFFDEYFHDFLTDVNFFHFYSSMTEEQSGIYSCSAILPNERRTVIQTRVRLKPDIILSQGKAIASTEGKDVLLECLLGSDFVF